eukprot:m.96485 g.96485  ORF g.96485 m.96485 type:complete len:118 (+) comp8635_c0_seq3:437-790(+)
MFEVDHPTVVASKQARIGHSMVLSKGLDGVADRYHLVAADLRDVPALAAALTAAGLDLSVPTVVLAECVLVYVEPAAAAAILAWLGQAFADIAFINYEPVTLSRQSMRGMPRLSIAI